MRNLLLSAVTILMAGTAFAASAQAAVPKGAAHNIVLVHGAFVDQTSWQPVADILTKKGYHVTLVVDAMTDRDADSHRHSVEKIFPRLGETAKTDDLLKLLHED